MTLQLNSSSFQKICYTCPHLLDEILSLLSASEAAYVLALINLPGNERSRASKKYIKPIRDIPEHEQWINMMASKGHAVFLVGSDVPRLMMRLRSPLLYWKSFWGESFEDEKPLRIWLAVRVSRGIHRGRQQRLESSGYATYSVLRDGTTTYGAGIKKLRETDMVLTDSNVIVPPGGTKVDEWGLWSPQWKRNSLNGSHIEIVWAHFPALSGGKHDVTPRVNLCPLQDDARHLSDVMGGRHCSVGGNNACSKVTPGGQPELFGCRKDKVQATIPYVCLNTGEQSMSEAIDDGELQSDEYAFIIRFRCMDDTSGPQIRSEIHGIPWPSDRRVEAGNGWTITAMDNTGGPREVPVL
ncbi:hypothetical protein BHE90_017168 [Fusarium euwallaceae]|uniref:Uncharacterized protein n=1 Tax=Fusarium euwallaceae TaxID=1147111 RepID=A0A430KYF6_9HYPO|nr:hypothetical protein BHE90_017168 [Fusarium euwallaceae]